MILGKVTDNLRKQNWTGLTLELMVLVIGIFLGFQLESWNEDRKDSIIEARYIDRLIADTTFNINQANTGLTDISEHGDILLQIIDMLEADTIDKIYPDDAKRVFCYWYINEDVRMRTSTYDELIATGNLAIISDENLREQVHRSQAEYEKVKYDIDVVGAALPELARVIRPYIKWYLTDVAQINSDGDIARETCTTDFASMVGNQEVISILTQLYRGHRVMSATRQVQITSLNTVLSELEKFKTN